MSEEIKPLDNLIKSLKDLRKSYLKDYDLKDKEHELIYIADKLGLLEEYIGIQGWER